MKIINKDDCLQTLNAIKMYGGINIPLSAFDTFDRLIEEHFSPQSLKFEELHENMWVYDKAFKVCRQVHKLYNNGERNIIQFKSNHYPELAEAYFFEENRFYPIIIPIIGDNNEKHI